MWLNSHNFTIWLTPRRCFLFTSASQWNLAFFFFSSTNDVFAFPTHPSSKWNTWVSSLAYSRVFPFFEVTLKGKYFNIHWIFFLFILCFLVFRECRVARWGGGQHSGEPVTDTLLYQQCTRSVTPSCTTIWCTRSIVSLKVGHSQRFAAAQYWMLSYDGTCTEFRELNGRSDIGDRCLLHPYKGSSLH